MNHEELIKKISYNTGYTQFEVRDVLSNLSDVVAESLYENECVNILGIGKFDIIERPAKSGIIHTGVDIGKRWYKPIRKEPTFKIANSIKNLFITK